MSCAFRIQSTSKHKQNPFHEHKWPGCNRLKHFIPCTIVFALAAKVIKELHEVGRGTSLVPGTRRANRGLRPANSFSTDVGNVRVDFLERAVCLEASIQPADPVIHRKGLQGGQRFHQRHHSASTKTFPNSKVEIVPHVRSEKCPAIIFW